LKIRLVIWGTGCIAVSLLFYRELFLKLPQWLTVEGLQHHGVFHWGVFGLCVIWLWLKREDILPRMRPYKFSPAYTVAGIVMLLLSVLLPASDFFLIPEMLLGWLGIFTLLYGRAMVLPAMLLVVYSFSIAFPLLMDGWIGDLSVKMVVTVATFTGRLFGLPLNSDGPVISYYDAAGNPIWTTIITGCAGYATIGVFIALFALMMLDIRLPLRKAWYIFLIGLAGTWLQNLFRILLSLAAGYFWGRGALEAMHYNAAYVIFPLWYTLFVWIYLKQAGWRRLPERKKTPDETAEA
jgi:exosortase/archaeosortase family protein